jgi:hypothetical protein
MAHGPEEHLEHAEQAQHAAHDPFVRHVAMTMAIVAAILACVTLLSHREHTATLAFKNDASIKQAQASDQWSYFQAKKNRQYMYEVDADEFRLMAKDPNNPKAPEEASALAQDLSDKAKKYRQDGDEIEKEARRLENEREELEKKSEEAHHRADRFDLGELGVEFALVLCSVALLTKRREFWLAGIFSCLLGASVAVSGLFMHGFVAPH